MRNYVRGLVVLVVLAAGCGSKAPSDLKVVGTPTGEITGKMHVGVAFSRAMVASSAVGVPVAAPPITIEPPLPGDVTWSDDKTLVLWPKSTLPISTRYVVTVAKGTKALDGNALADDVTFEFVTERLSGSFDVLGSAEHAKPDQLVRVSFDQQVPLAQVTDHCHFAAASGSVSVKNGPESPSGPARSYTLAPSSALALDTAWTLTCDTELRGSIGNIGFDKPLEQKLHTYGPLHFVKLDPSGADIVPDESLALKLQFTNPLATPYQMTITPPVAGFPQQCHELGDDTPGVRCAVLLDAQTDYTLTIAAAQADAFGQKLGADETQKLHTTDAKPTLSMETGYFIAELKRPVLPVWTRNVKQLEVTAVPITQENFHELRPLLQWWENTPADLSKTKLAPKSKTIAITGAKNTWSQHPLDAAELYGGVPGPGMFYLGSARVTSTPTSSRRAAATRCSSTSRTSAWSASCRARAASCGRRGCRPASRCRARPSPCATTTAR